MSGKFENRKVWGCNGGCVACCGKVESQLTQSPLQFRDDLSTFIEHATNVTSTKRTFAYLPLPA